MGWASQDSASARQLQSSVAKRRRPYQRWSSSSTMRSTSSAIRAEHSVLLATLIPNVRLLVVPGNHGDYLGELVAAAEDPGRLRRRLPFLVDSAISHRCDHRP